MVGCDSGRAANAKQEVSTFRRALPQFCIVGVKNLILLGWGLILGYPTVLIPGLQHKFGNVTDNDLELISDEQVSWIGSINLLFVPFGSITSGLLMDSIGKRRMMQLLNLPMLLAWAFFYFGNSIIYIFVGLALSGMSGGLLEAPLILYISESVEPKYRGMLTASGTATVLGGVCLQFVIGSLLHWRYVAAVSAIIPFLACNAVLLIPESPYWLYARNRIDDAHKSLQWLRGWVTFETVEDEFQTIMYEVDDDKAQRKARKLEQPGLGGKLKPFVQRGFILPFLLIMFGFVSGHFSGMTPLQTYAFQILQTYEVPINEYYATILLGAAQVLGCVLGMVLVRSLGKRRIVFLSMIGCGACFFTVATYTYMYMDPVRQFNNTMSLAPLDNLEQSVIDALATIRNDIATTQQQQQQRQQTNRIFGDKVTSNLSDDGHSKYIQIGVYTVNTRNFSHVDAAILNEVLDLGLQLYAANNTNGVDQIKLREYLIVGGLTPQKSIVPNDPFSAEASNYVVIKSMRTNDADLIKRRELLHVIGNVLVPSMTYAYNDSESSQLIATIEQGIMGVLNSGCEQDPLCLENGIGAITRDLSAFVQRFETDDNSANGTNVDLRLLPLILLLAGSFFAHSGAKLFPWMLIGETYPIDCRSGAAGVSSAISYLIGFSSNKSFLSIVATISLHGTFWLYSAIAFGGCFVLYFILPETENKTLQEISVFFDKRKLQRFPMTSSANVDTK